MDVSAIGAGDGSPDLVKRLGSRYGFASAVFWAVWIAGCGVLDWWTGPEFASSAIYLPGVAAAGWFQGRRAGMLAAAMAAAVWLVAELAWHVSYAHPAVPYWNAATRWVIFLVTALLVTEVRMRRRVEKELRQKQGILASILEGMQDGVVVVDGNDRIVVFNAAAEELFGDGAVGRVCDEWLDGLNGRMGDVSAGHSPSVDVLKAGFSGVEGRNGELLFAREAGGASHVSYQVKPLGGVTSPVMGRVAVFHDETARRLMDKRVLEAVELEQRALASRLHDGLSQDLAGVAFAVDDLQQELVVGGAEAAAGKAGEIAALIRAGIRRAKDLAREIFPVGLDEGFLVSLNNLAIASQARGAVDCKVIVTGRERELEEAVSGHLIRIAQEGVANALRHAHPHTVEIRVDFQQHAVVMSIVDDGIGFEEAEVPVTGIGLQIIRYRARLIGARIAIEANEPRGSRIVCSLPYSRQ